MTSEQRTAGRDEPRTPGEKMMAAYLDERSVPYRYESFGEGANPDFRADHPVAGEVMLEVYEPGYLLPRNPDGSYRSGAVAPPGRVVRRGLTSRRKSRQAAVARDLGIPFVLVIASTNAELAIGEHDIPGALFGSPEFQWSADAGPDEPGRLVFGSGGRLQAHLNTRFSAVAVITRGAADTPAARAVPGVSSHAVVMVAASPDEPHSTDLATGTTDSLKFLRSTERRHTGTIRKEPAQQPTSHHIGSTCARGRGGRALPATTAGGITHSDQQQLRCSSKLAHNG